jgi:hypothetical protein
MSRQPGKSWQFPRRELEALNQWFTEIGYIRIDKSEVAEKSYLYCLGARECAKIKKVPEALAICLKNLRELRLTDAPLRALPENIGELEELEFLELGNRIYAELEKNVMGVRQNTEFKCLPASVTRLKKLKRLDIRHTALGKLPEDFGELNNLEYLNLSCNELENLPASMAGLKKLKTLDLGGHLMPELPAWIQGFDKLEHLTIWGSRLRAVPEWLGEMPSLLSLGCPEELNPPMLARARRKLSLPLGRLQAEFLSQVGRLGFELPEENVAARKRGSLPPDAEEEGIPGLYGNVCDYLFGRGEKGEYVDYYIAHRIWGDRHVRIWETGETERLETFSVMFSPPDEVHEIGERLHAKGFSPTY